PPGRLADSLSHEVAVRARFLPRSGLKRASCAERAIRHIGAKTASASIQDAGGVAMSAPAGEVVRVLYKKGGVRLKPGRRYVIQMPPEVFRVRLTVLHFESNKCFLLPSGIRGMQGLAGIYGKTPGLVLIIQVTRERTQY